MFLFEHLFVNYRNIYFYILIIQVLSGERYDNSIEV